MNERIKELRKYLGLNQTEFGRRIGVKQGSIASYENGVRIPLEAIIYSICKEYRVNEEWLRTGKGEMFVDIGDRLSAYVSEITDGDDDFIKDFIEIYMELSPTSKAAIREMSKKMAEKYIKREQENTSALN